MKIDLVGPRQRGLAMGFNEAAGCGAVALAAADNQLLAARYGLRPAPFLLGLSYALIALGLCAVFVRETRRHAQLEASQHDNSHPDTALTNRQIFLRTSFTEPALSSASQAGLVNNLNFGLSWGLFPILFATTHMRVDRIGILVAIYPAVWGIGQIATGALSDRWGRKHLITAGMLTQAAGLALIATGDTFNWWLAATALLGAGTAMVYPTLLDYVGDVAHPLWRARAIGVYRLWRDSGYAQAPSSAASPPTYGECGRQSGPPAPSPSPRPSLSRCACTKPIQSPTDPRVSGRRGVTMKAAQPDGKRRRREPGDVPPDGDQGCGDRRGGGRALLRRSCVPGPGNAGGRTVRCHRTLIG